MQTLTWTLCAAATCLLLRAAWLLDANDDQVEATTGVRPGNTMGWDDGCD